MELKPFGLIIDFSISLEFLGKWRNQIIRTILTSQIIQLERNDPKYTKLHFKKMFLITL